MILSFLAAGLLVYSLFVTHTVTSAVEALSKIPGELATCSRRWPTFARGLFLLRCFRCR